MATLNSIKNSGLLGMILANYTYQGTYNDRDTVGDTRKSTPLAGEILTEICTVASAVPGAGLSTKGLGTWKPIFSQANKSLTDSNESEGAGSYFNLQTGYSGKGSINFGDAAGYAEFIFTAAAVVTLLSWSSNVFTSLQTGTNHVIIKDQGTNVRIVNELGATTNFSITVNYNI